MEAISLPIYNAEGKEIDSVKLDAKVFDGSINSNTVWQTVCAFRANQRKGLASTKTRGEVRGGGKKPWRQKGTGRARAGSIRSPLWRHGGVIFGPHPRDFYYKLPDKIKKSALRSCLNAKLKENNVIILEELKVAHAKTKEALKVLSNLKVRGKEKAGSGNLLLVLEKKDDNLMRALKNVSSLSVSLAGYTNAYEVLSSKKIIITKEGLNALTSRLKQ